MFFFISGFLYGHKEIKEVGKWYKKQILKIVIPVYIYELIMTIVLLSIGKLGDVDIVKSVLMLMNLRGFIDAGIGNVITGHLWFISFILLCYLITPLLQKLRKVLIMKQAIMLLSGLTMLEIVIMIIVRPGGFWSGLSGVLLYSLAYFIGAFWDKRFSWRTYTLLTVAMIISICLRLIFKHYADVDAGFVEDIYRCIVAPYSHCILGSWIFFSIYCLLTPSKKLLDFAFPICKVGDKYSYEVYICHYMFLTGVLSLNSLTGIKSVNVLAFVACTIAFALVLNKVSGFINKLLANKRDNT